MQKVKYIYRMTLLIIMRWRRSVPSKVHEYLIYRNNNFSSAEFSFQAITATEKKKSEGVINT